MRTVNWAQGLIAGVLMAWISSACAYGQMQLEPAIVQLSGAIVLEHHYGPPNFGETSEVDREICVLILELDSPISVVADHGTGTNVGSFENVQAVQLLGSQELGLDAFVGRHVSVEGKLFEKHGGEHYTDVLMNVQKVTSIN